MSSSEGRSAPEGVECDKHPARRAFFTCPRCQRHVCLVCWQDVVDRCHDCITADPTADIDPPAWEQPGSLWSRYFRTLASVSRPRASAPSFAHDNVPAAVRFLLLSALPLALLAGVIPHTRTLRFGGSFGVELLGQPETWTIGLDVLRAAGIQVLVSGLEIAFLAMPFVSLVKAYGTKGRAHAALRVVLYRAWLLPFAWLLFSLGMWAMPLPVAPITPQDAPMGYRLLFLVRDVLPLWVLLSMVTTARLCCGLGPFISMVVVIVSALLYAQVGLLTSLLPWLSPPAV